MGSRLKVLREAAGLTQENLARAIGVTPTGYQKWEYGKRSFSFETAIKLAAALGVDLNVLAGIESTAKPKRRAK